MHGEDRLRGQSDSDLDRCFAKGAKKGRLFLTRTMQKLSTKFRTTTLVSWNQSSFTKSSNRRQDFVSSFGPDERLRMFVVSVDVVSNGRFEFAGATEYTPSNLFFREQREPALHQIDPG